MPDYTPASRRPIAGVFRATAHTAVRLCIRLRIHPDTVSYLSIVAAAGAAIAFLYSTAKHPLLLTAAALCILRLWFNMLDGMVALASGQASRRGEIVNELPDRISDILIFAGIAHSGFCNPFLAYWAAILAVMTAYVGTLGQATTGRRRFEGLMSKQYRMATVSAASVILFFLHPSNPRPAPAPLFPVTSIMDWALWLVVVGCVQTIIVRLRKMLAEIQ